MTAAANDKPSWLVGTLSLKGPLLMLVLERPGHAYEIASRLIQRLGSGWAIEPGDIYPMLERLQRKGLLEGRYEPHPGKPSRGRPHREICVYHPTDLTAGAVMEWLSMPVTREPERSELLARFASLREEHAPDLLRALDEYERACFASAAESEMEIPTDTWMGTLMELVRKRASKRLKGELEWVELARQSIKERSASTL